MTGKLLVSAILAAAIVSGCKEPNTVHMKYDAESGKLRPVLLRGEVIEFEDAVNWVFGVSPCKEGARNITTCTIKADAPNAEFPYLCEGKNCDPEIAVEDSHGVKNVVAGAVTPLPAAVIAATTTIYIGCDAGRKMVLEPADVPDAVGTIQWSSPNEQAKPWKVTLQKDTLCQGKKTEFGYGEQCVVQAGAGTVEYIAESENSSCDTGKTATGKVTAK